MRLIITGVLLLAIVGLAQGSEQASAVYELGKQRYDAKDYAGALEKFDAAVALEPGKARWHYNRGLALKKLHRDGQARAAFVESRRLEPDYKRKEIDEKLGELQPESRPGPGPTAPPVEDDVGAEAWLICAVPLAFLGFIGFVVWRFLRSRRQGPQPTLPPPVAVDPAAFAPARAQLAALGSLLARLEHAMSLGEDTEARVQLDRASAYFQQARRNLGRGQGVPAELSAALQRGQAAARLAEARLRALHGAAFDVAQGPRAGCFFCARPLPTSEAGHALSLKLGGQQQSIVACAACARRAGPHEAPPVTLINGAHWARAGVDPYAFFYEGAAPFTEAPLSSVARAETDLSHVASLAGAVALGAVAGAVAAQVLDVDALWESDAASLASAASARSASQRKSDRDWKDHS